jgi:hypothetical protein
MFCPSCGKQTEDVFNFCPHCGSRLAPPQEATERPMLPGMPTASPDEQTIFSFGPFGVTVCEGPYSMFKWQRKNITTIALTNQRICGVANRRFGPGALPETTGIGGRAQFNIPYSSIISVEVYQHPANLGLMNVLDITYSDGSTTMEKSICSYSNNINQAYGIIVSLRGLGGPGQA